MARECERMVCKVTGWCVKATKLMCEGDRMVCEGDKAHV